MARILDENISPGAINAGTRELDEAFSDSPLRCTGIDQVLAVAYLKDAALNVDKNKGKINFAYYQVQAVISMRSHSMLQMAQELVMMTAAKPIAGTVKILSNSIILKEMDRDMDVYRKVIEMDMHMPDRTSRSIREPAVE